MATKRKAPKLSDSVTFTRLTLGTLVLPEATDTVADAAEVTVITLSDDDESATDSVALLAGPADATTASPIAKIPRRTRLGLTGGHLLETSGSHKEHSRPVLKTSDLTVATQRAQQEEIARMERIAEEHRRFTWIMMSEGTGRIERLVLAVDTQTNEPLIEISHSIVGHLKLHQAEGIRFMFDSCFESIDMIRNQVSPGGCILAHCMGLGKTLQSVALIHTLLTNPVCCINRVLVLCPLSVATNWDLELHRWIGNENPVHIHKLFESIPENRMLKLSQWYNDGGVGILHYELFCRLVVPTDKAVRDFELEAMAKEAFLDPGPDLVLLDEGHILKRSNSVLSLAVNRMETGRRIILTGTPLQNNIKEYYTMVNFVKPRLLGTMEEFSNQFVNPVERGQADNATRADVRKMKWRAHVLHKKLEGCVQMKDSTILSVELPPKYEYVLYVRLSEEQERLYKKCCIDLACRPKARDKKKGTLFSYYSELSRIWSHPHALTMQTTPESDGDEDGYEVAGTNPNRSHPSWWTGLLSPTFEPNTSGKLLILRNILTDSIAEGDKTWGLGGNAKGWDYADSGSNGWTLNVDYYRVDGKTQAHKRQSAFNAFNSPTSSAKVFLLSTKVGGLGVNLQGANRVVLFDASWNPSQDQQCIFRVYRYGQGKTCYVYRLVARGTMEEHLLNGQIKKLSLFKRVVEERQTKCNLKSRAIRATYDYVEEPSMRGEPSLVQPGDSVLGKVLKSSAGWISSYHEFDSLHNPDIELNSEDKERAWEEYNTHNAQPVKRVRPRVRQKGRGLVVDRWRGSRVPERPPELSCAEKQAKVRRCIHDMISAEIIRKPELAAIIGCRLRRLVSEFSISDVLLKRMKAEIRASFGNMERKSTRPTNDHQREKGKRNSRYSGTAKKVATVKPFHIRNNLGDSAKQKAMTLKRNAEAASLPVQPHSKTFPGHKVVVQRASSVMTSLIKPSKASTPAATPAVCPAAILQDVNITRVGRGQATVGVMDIENVVPVEIPAILALEPDGRDQDDASPKTVPSSQPPEIEECGKQLPEPLAESLASLSENGQPGLPGCTENRDSSIAEIIAPDHFFIDEIEEAPEAEHQIPIDIDVQTTGRGTPSPQTVIHTLPLVYSDDTLHTNSTTSPSALPLELLSEKQMKRKASTKRYIERRRERDKADREAGIVPSRYLKDRARLSTKERKTQTPEELDSKREKHKLYQRERRERIQKGKKSQSAPTPESQIFSDDFLSIFLPTN